MGKDNFIVKNVHGYANVGDFLLAVQRVIGYSDWPNLKCWWPLEGEFPYALSIPEAIESDFPQEKKHILQPETLPENGKRKLRDLWRKARPTGRKGTPAAAPACWLILFQSDSEDLYQYMVSHAPDGLLLVEFRDLDSKEKKGVKGFYVYGPPGKAIAHAPPSGCDAFECDTHASGSRAALPIGWTRPRIPEFLWPQGDILTLYDRVDVQDHHVRLLQPKLSVPLAGLLAAAWDTQPLKPFHSESLNIMKMPKVAWQVVKRRTSPRANEQLLAAGERRPSVFRIRTSDGHFGPTMLRVLDEAEARIIPDFSHAAMDWESDEGRERWHFLFSEQVDGKLISAWSMLERFDFVPELAECGLTVFIASDSRVTPPFGLVLSAARDRAVTIRHIRALLGNPPERTLVLIEASQENIDKPLVTYIPLATTRSLAEVIGAIVRQWDIERPAKAVHESISAPNVAGWRERASKRLKDIAKEENQELQQAVQESQKALTSEAARAKQELNEACEPVNQAFALAIALGQALTRGETTFADACAALKEITGLLTAPRRAWLKEQTKKCFAALEKTAPRLNEMQEVQQTSVSLIGNLSNDIQQLTRTGNGLRDLIPKFENAQKHSDRAIQESQDLLEDIEQRGVQVEAALRVQLAETRKNLSLAQERQGELQREKERLENERAAVSRLEQQNNDLAQENERNSEELTRRRQKAESEKIRLEEIRDIEIPRLKKETEEAERQLQEMDPQRIESELAEVRSRLDIVLAEKRQAEKKLNQFNDLVSQEKEELCRLQSLQEKIRIREAEISQLRKDIQEAERQLREMEPERVEHELSQAETQLQSMRTQIKSAKENQLRLDQVRQEIAELKPKHQAIAPLENQLRMAGVERELLREEITRVCVQGPGIDAAEIARRQTIMKEAFRLFDRKFRSRRSSPLQVILGWFDRLSRRPR